MALKSVVFVIVALSSAPYEVASFGLRRTLDPEGPGHGEANMGLACQECEKHKDYLDKPDPCSCFATDVAGTFENDATKTTTRKIGKSAEGSKGAGTHTMETETTNIGAERLPESWHWHCRPITDTEGVWKQC